MPTPSGEISYIDDDGTQRTQVDHVLPPILTRPPRA